MIRRISRCVPWGGPGAGPADGRSSYHWGETTPSRTGWPDARVSVTRASSEITWCRPLARWRSRRSRPHPKLSAGEGPSWASQGGWALTEHGASAPPGAPQGARVRGRLGPDRQESRLWSSHGPTARPGRRTPSAPSFAGNWRSATCRESASMGFATDTRATCCGRAFTPRSFRSGWGTGRWDSRWIPTAIVRPDQETGEELPPTVRCLRGSLTGSDLDRDDYRKHIEEKHR